MASSDLGEQVREELCLLGVDLFPEVKDFRGSPRKLLKKLPTALFTELMNIALKDIASRTNRQFISRKRVRHDTLQLFKEGKLAECFPVPEGGCLTAALPVTNGLVARWNAANLNSLPGGIVEGDPVTFWNDSSSGGHDATSTPPGIIHPSEVGNLAPPIYREPGINGLPAIEGGDAPGTKRTLFVGDQASLELDDYSIFIVLQMPPTKPSNFAGIVLAIQNYIANPQDELLEAGMVLAMSLNQVSYDFAGSSFLQDGFLVSADEVALITTTKNGTAIKLFKNSFDMVPTVLGSIPASVDYTTPFPKHTTIFQSLQGFPGDPNTTGVFVDGFEGLIGEILIYDREVSSFEKSETDEYLRCKWGIVFDPLVPICDITVPTTLPVTAGLLAHFDATDTGSLPGGIGEGDDVTFWNDLSGGGFDASAVPPPEVIVTGATSAPIYRATAINGLPGIDGDTAATNGGILWLGDKVEFELNDYTIFVVAKDPDSDPNTNSPFLTLQSQNNASLNFGPFPTQGMTGIFAGIGSIFGTVQRRLVLNHFQSGLRDTQVTPNTINVFSFLNLSSDASVFVNGFDAGATGLPMTTDFTTLGKKETVLFGIVGADPSDGTKVLDTTGVGASGRESKAVIGEIVIYNVALSNTDRSSVEQYLLCKWGFV